MRLAIFGLIAVGLLLRVLVFVVNPSLSIDEAQLGLNVIGRSFSGLAKQLDFNQGAPLGFLEAVKAATSAFGMTEFGLRALPLTAGLLSLPLFYRVASGIVQGRSLLIALTLFSISSPLIVFAATAKQYSSDVLIGLVLYVFGIRALHGLRTQDLGLLGLIGAAAVWFSHPAVFFLAGITLVLTLAISLRGERRLLVPMILPTFVWVASFIGSYIAARRTLQHLRHSIEGASPTLTSISGRKTETFAESAAGSFRYLLGLGHFGLGAVDLGDVVAIVFGIVFVLGFVVSCRRNWERSLLLTAPLILAFTTIALGRYPLFPRASLFAVPALVVFAASGLATVTTRFRSFARSIVVWSVAAVCLVFSVSPGLEAGLAPSEREALRPVMKYLATAEQPQEGLYLYHTTQYAFSYYLRCRCYGPGSSMGRAESRRLWPVQPTQGLGEWDPALRSSSSQIVIGRRFGARAQDQIRDFARIPRRKIVWVIFADIGTRDRRFLIRCLDRFGKQTRSFAGGDDMGAARAYRYTFGKSSTSLGRSISLACAGDGG